MPDYPVSLSFISVAAINRPELTANGMIANSAIETTKNKIRTIMRIGLIHGHDSLVLGAFGCGAFRNPPRHMARLFHEIINEREFASKYRCIIFAILDDHNAYQVHKPRGQFQTFCRGICLVFSPYAKNTCETTLIRIIASHPLYMMVNTSARDFIRTI